ncbi:MULTISPECIES: hypothetical protein [Paenibacillus]|uniref:DUF3311 domain-containing protein n=1 Tax=Paenibacillus radicis (ex Xue et al. 2023) TaxID=2972489 RepID=A0ABT1YF13_9BACL|nr:hypothetical protein [Paenibacillus radicis (ex Xue et al. 2023)]MCR8631004.1 hypothetical protein [Paenibacillus radicis (ex Xue et al. 2023)]
MKMILFILLLLMYPLFLHWIKISDLRVIPLVIPYALGVLSITIMLTGIAEYVAGKFKNKSDKQ